MRVRRGASFEAPQAGAIGRPRHERFQEGDRRVPFRIDGARGRCRSACATSAARSAGASSLIAGGTLVERGHEWILRRRCFDTKRRICVIVRFRMNRGGIRSFAARCRASTTASAMRGADLPEPGDVVRRVLRGADGVLDGERVHQSDVRAVELIEREYVVVERLPSRGRPAADSASGRQTTAAPRSGATDRSAPRSWQPALMY